MAPIFLAAVVSGSIYALIALGFALAFRLSSVFNLTHGTLIIAAGYLNYWFDLQGWSPWTSVALALLTITAVGTLGEAFLIPRAKEWNLGNVDLLLLSWFGMLVAQDSLSILFENQSIYLGREAVQEGFAVLGGSATPTQAWIVAASFLVGGALYLFVQKSPVGQEIVAIGDDARLAQIYGLNIRRLTLLNSAAAALLTAAAGVAMSYQERIEPALGFRFSVVAIVATLIGHPLGPAGAVAGAYILAFLESFVLYLVDPSLRDAAVYLGLILIVTWTYRRSGLPVGI